MLIGSQAHVMGLYAPPWDHKPRGLYHVFFAHYVKVCAKIEDQGVILTFDTHLASFTHLADCKYKLEF